MKIAYKNCTQFVNKVNKHKKMKPVGLGVYLYLFYPTGFTILNYI